jgi:hypothetical protein
MKKLDIYSVHAIGTDDKKAIDKCLKAKIEMTVDEQGRVYNEAGQYIADVREVEQGNGDWC